MGFWNGPTILLAENRAACQVTCDGDRVDAVALPRQADPRMTLTVTAEVLCRALLGRELHPVSGTGGQVQIIRTELAVGDTDCLDALTFEAVEPGLAAIFLRRNIRANLIAFLGDVIVAEELPWSANLVDALSILTVLLLATDLGDLPAAAVRKTYAGGVIIAGGTAPNAQVRHAKALITETIGLAMLRLQALDTDAGVLIANHAEVLAVLV